MKKFSFLFALLCASVMGFAIDWSGYEYLGDGAGGGAYSNKYKLAPAEGQGVVNIQHPGWATADGIYTTFPAGIIDCSLGAGKYSVDGAGMILHLSAFTAQETEVTVTHGLGTCVFTVYYEDGEPDDLTGWNIAKGKKAYAGHVAENGIAAANDGDKGTRWGSNGAAHYSAVGENAEDWWYVDLGDFYQVDQIKILFQTAAPTDYDLLISNNAASWTVIGTYTTQPKTGNTDENYNVYDFTDKVGRYVKIFARNGYNNMQYGISMYEFEVYGVHASIDDHNPPTMTSASLSGDPSYDQVNIAVAGTDPEDGVVTMFHVVDLAHSVDQSLTAEAGVITVTGLNAETSYTFTITALDAAGNESANSVNVAATTAQDTSIPLVAAPVPSGTGKEILPIYCDAFASILEHEFDKDGFAGVTLMMEQNISGDHCLVYNVAGANEITWGHYNGSNDEICAQSEYRGSGMGVDASAMEYLHIDIWSLQAGTNVININVNDAALASLRLSHNGNGWQGYDIAMSDFGFNPANPAFSSDNVRWMKFNGIGFISGKMALDNVYFWKTATGLHAVSATANNALFGTASVVVTETGLAPEGGMVTDGTEVTFSATPNDGYIFVNWSNGNTNATFNATVDATMNLTANFRALGTIYCNTVLHSNNGGQEHDAYVTMKRSGENEYQLIVRTTEALSNFGGTNFYKPNNVHVIDIRNQGVLSNNNHTLTVTFSCDKEPYMTNPLYVVLQGGFEAHFPQLTNIEYSQPCADPEITAIELNKTEATLDMGNTLTLVPTFTPAYMSVDITWQTSDPDVATVDNGVVTPVAAGNVTITAEVTEDIKATCAVTVQNAASHNWYGYGTDKDIDYTYRIEYTTDHHIVAHVKRQGDKVGLVTPFMNISNNITDINVTEGEETGWWKGKTAITYTAGTNIHILIQSNFAGASSIIEFDYEVGSDNVMPTILPSTLTLSNNSLLFGVGDPAIQLTAEIHHTDAANKTLTWNSDDNNVATVVNGLVTPVGVGTTTIHAITHNGISASCDVTVVGALETQTYWGNGTSDGVAIAYSITRNANHTLTYTVEVMHDKNGFWIQVNDGEYHTAPLSEGLYSWTSETSYIDGAVVNGFFYAPYDGGAAHIDFTYTVGSESSQRYIPLTMNDEQDNSEILNANNGQIRDITSTRTFTQPGEWYTLCLPFDLNEAQLAEALGAGYTLATLTGSDDRGELIHLNFDYVRTLQAGKPYMFKTAEVVENPVFQGVTVKNVNPETMKSTSEYMNFQGTFSPVTLNSDNQFFVGPENYLYSPAEGGTLMDAFRCYFTIPASAKTSVGAKRARIVFAPEVATDIENIQSTDSQATKVIENGVLYIIRDNHMYNAQGLLVK